MMQEYLLEHGTEKDIDELGQLYDDINDYLAAHINYPGWRKEIYPVRETAITGVDQHNLYVVRDNGKIAGSVILNHEPENGYSNAVWKYDGNYSDILVVHTLVVHPDYLKRGIGTDIMRNAIDLAVRMGMRSMRLDVYEKNSPAIKLYEKHGFEYIDKVDLGYGIYGLDWYLLYEKLL